MSVNATMPRVLYKYATIETVRTILSAGTLRFWSPLRYNDPFDSQWDMFWQTRTREARQQLETLIEEAIRDPTSISPDASPAFRASICTMHNAILNLPTDQQEPAIKKAAREAAQKPADSEPHARLMLNVVRASRVLCLSETDCSILMWSHYADRHRGMVLGFDATALKAELCKILGGHAEKRILRAVEYPNDPPPVLDVNAWASEIAFGSMSENFWDAERLGEVYYFTKHAGWHYEREWRFVWNAPLNALGEFADFKFPKNAIVEVIAGCRTDVAQAKELLGLSMAHRPDVQYFKMEMHPSRFELAKRNNSVAGEQTARG